MESLDHGYYHDNSLRLASMLQRTCFWLHYQLLMLVHSLAILPLVDRSLQTKTWIQVSTTDGGQPTSTLVWNQIRCARQSIVNHGTPIGIFETWADGASLADQKAIKHDLTYNRMPILKALSPSAGSYVNEVKKNQLSFFYRGVTYLIFHSTQADVNSPTWRQDYFGSKYNTVKAIKTKYDPNEFCTNCVGSEKWKSTDGRLCLAWKIK